MYHLIKALYLHASSLPEYSILLLGLDAAGKTTLLNQIKNLYNSDDLSASSQQNPGKTVPTVGQNVSVVALPDLYLRIWDVGGQHSLRGLWQSYYKSCHAIIFVVDSTDIGDADISKLPPQSPSSSEHIVPASMARTAFHGSSFDESSTRLGECRLVLESILSSADAEGVPILVLANKQDREDSLEVVRIKEGFVRRVVEGEKGGSVRDSRVLPCSALTGTGVKEAVEWVSSRVKWNKEARPPVMR